MPTNSPTPTMEHYSPALEASVRQQLQAASSARLRELGDYYQQRQGPGFALLRAEYLRRGWPDPAAKAPRLV